MRQARPLEDGRRFRILFVCTGNICRSPIAERFLCRALGPGSAVVVGSAGTQAVEGAPMSPHSVRVLTRMGADAEGFAARPLTTRMLVEADLVLTATGTHRAQVVSRYPQASRRVFTIVEFGLLSEAVISRASSASAVFRHRDPVRRAHALVEEARGRRGLVQVEDPDVPDPFRRSAWAYRRAARRIAGALWAPATLLTGTVTPPPRPMAGRW
ncbi:arsenate reductase/protein-tyrosine-phosphatase family protein [Sphaerisporangium fuscum]|uniref:arsenate reductase/protein-tyrosine-phosphatase family protein n=1 Tax=Sphaerisporangium fuscum TaxID=2835868 RepID=UPI001BDC7835|nr:hypothetical protein [Sphaerisporangium fuscum]